MVSQPAQHNKACTAGASSACQLSAPCRLRTRPPSSFSTLRRRSISFFTASAEGGCLPPAGAPAGAAAGAPPVDSPTPAASPPPSAVGGRSLWLRLCLRRLRLPDGAGLSPLLSELRLGLRWLRQAGWGRQSSGLQPPDRPAEAAAAAAARKQVSRQGISRPTVPWLTWRASESSGGAESRPQCHCRCRTDCPASCRQYA